MEYLEDEDYEKLQYEGSSFCELSMSDCRFRNCTFLDLELCNLRIHNCEFYNCVIGNVNMDDASMLNCHFIDCILIGIDWNELQDGKLIPFVEIKNCVLRYNYFTNFTLSNYNFESCTFEGCTFDQCNLTDTSFQKANLKETQFLRCNLCKCDFRDASNYNIDIKENKVKDTKFSFPEAICLLETLGIIVE